MPRTGPITSWRLQVEQSDFQSLVSNQVLRDAKYVVTAAQSYAYQQAEAGAGQAMAMTLIVRNVQPSDSGEYSCLAMDHESSNMHTASAALTVRPTDAPRFPPLVEFGPPDALELSAGQRLQLDCRALRTAASQRPAVAWTRDRHPLLDGSLLTINSTHSTTGIYSYSYTCLQIVQ